MNDIKLSLLLKMVSDSFDKHLTSKVVDLNLTSSQCKIIGYLHLNNDREINPMDIEREFRLKRPTVTGILKRLEEKDFITFKPSNKDKRYKQIVLTEKSKVHHEMMKKNINLVEEVMYSGITKDEIDNIEKVLKVMLKNMADE